MAQGSPTSGTRMDGQEIALRMIQVAEAASVAAQSAAASLGRRSEGDKNRFRVLPKPANFDAKTREEELYQASRGTTSYELIHGKAYDGLLVPLACPVHAFVRPQSGKGNPTWRMNLFLGKTEGQDSWIVGDGSRVMLTRSVRRLARPWKSFLAYYQNFTAASFEYQVNFGGRIVPSKRAARCYPTSDDQGTT